MTSIDVLVSVLTGVERGLCLHHSIDATFTEILHLEKRLSEVRGSLLQLRGTMLSEDIMTPEILLQHARLIFSLRDLQQQVQMKQTWQDWMIEELRTICDYIIGNIPTCILLRDEMMSFIKYDEQTLANNIQFLLERLNVISSNQTAQTHSFSHLLES